MNLKQALKRLPPDVIVSVGCKEAPGWFYFSRVKDVNTRRVTVILNEKIHDSLYSKKLNINEIKHDLKDYEYIQRSTTKGYIEKWKKLLSDQENYEDLFKEFVACSEKEVLNTKVSVIFKRSDSTYGILLDRWKVSGQFWYYQEWEEKYGAL